MNSRYADMTFPVRCAYCGRVYDMGKVEVTGRWLDCTAWKAPCCGTPVDDRGDTGWKTKKDYYRLDRDEPEFDVYGQGYGRRWGAR